MTIEAKVIADSISPQGIRLTTMQLVYPRWIHSEFLTHRVFSRNASSSRAIPVAKMIEQVRTNPAMPVHWGKNQPGMQAHEEISEEQARQAELAWRRAAENAALNASMLQELGLHKQVVNRILEPFQHIHVIVTATDWGNFFHLRAHPDAQPEIRVLAEAMLKAQDESTPTKLQPGEWHLPYVEPGEQFTLGLENAKKCSAARCARVSYLTHDGQKPSLVKDLGLFDRLVGSNPIHASPTEHQATPDYFRGRVELPNGDMMEVWQNTPLHGNLYGWVQHRKLIEQSVAS